VEFLDKINLAILTLLGSYLHTCMKYTSAERTVQNS